MMRSIPAIAVSLLLVSALSRAETISYAIVVGNNTPPAQDGETSLPQLHYADDDAVRYFQFFSRFASRTFLLSVLDGETQKRYPELSARSDPPTLANLTRVVDELAGQMKSDKERGDESVLYFVYSGHGAIDSDGKAYLAFLDGGLTQSILYEQVLGKLPAAYSHLFVDACHAGAVVGARGMFDREKDARVVPVSRDEALMFAEPDGSNRFPGLGVLIATTADQEAHEWSRIQSGVFTHELLSGLHGPADVNGDGLIEYSEIHAFVASANREIRDPRALPRVVSRPPLRNQNIALVALSQFRDTVTLSGNPTGLGHFHIEMENGQRLLDANLSELMQVLIVVPAGARFFVRTTSGEVEIRAGRGEEVKLSSLVLAKRELTSRGSIDAAYRAALFASPFGVTYYKGFVDSIGAVGVQFSGAIPSIRDRAHAGGSVRKPLAIGTLVVAGGSAVAAIVTGALAIKAKYDFDHTSLQREAYDLSEKYQTFGNAALATGVIAAVAGLATWLLWPDSDSEGPPVSVGRMPGSGQGLVLGISW